MSEETLYEIEVEISKGREQTEAILDTITVEIPWWAVDDYETHLIVMKEVKRWAENNGYDHEDLAVDYEDPEVEDRNYWIIVSRSGDSLTNTVYRYSEDAAYSMWELAREAFTREQGFSWQLDMDEHELKVCKVEDSGEAIAWITYGVMELELDELPDYQDYDLA